MLIDIYFYANSKNCVNKCYFFKYLLQLYLVALVMISFAYKPVEKFVYTLNGFIHDITCIKPGGTFCMYLYCMDLMMMSPA